VMMTGSTAYARPGNTNRRLVQTVRLAQGGVRE
jgi:hypothetical protein